MTRAAAGLMTIAAALAATLASLPAAADDYRIGVIHIERILRDSPPARTALERIEQQFKARDAELAGRETTLRNDVAQYEKDKPKLDADGRGARERDLDARGRELVRQRQQFAEDVRARQFEELDKLKERLDQVLTRLAHDRGYDLILQNALWVAKSVDITDEVIKALGP
jgi:outer membrane protein